MYNGIGTYMYGRNLRDSLSILFFGWERGEVICCAAGPSGRYQAHRQADNRMRRLLQTLSPLSLSPLSLLSLISSGSSTWLCGGWRTGGQQMYVLLECVRTCVCARVIDVLLLLLLLLLYCCCCGCVAVATDSTLCMYVHCGICAHVAST